MAEILDGNAKDNASLSMPPREDVEPPVVWRKPNGKGPSPKIHATPECRYAEGARAKSLSSMAGIERCQGPKCAALWDEIEEEGG